LARAGFGRSPWKLPRAGRLALLARVAGRCGVAHETKLAEPRREKRGPAPEISAKAAL